jgi:cytochrome b561
LESAEELDPDEASMTFNSTTTWGWPAKALHWIGAVIILLLLVHGWWMTHMTPRPERLANYAWHAALGYDLLALTIIRMLWRWLNPVPAMPADLKRWEVLAARAGHIGLYLLLFAASLSGWALAGTFKRPWRLDLFGLPIRRSVARQPRAARLLRRRPTSSLLICRGAHRGTSRSLRHHVFKRNDVMRRMWFGHRAGEQASTASSPVSAKSIGS